MDYVTSAWYNIYIILFLYNIYCIYFYILYIIDYRVHITYIGHI